MPHDLPHDLPHHLDRRPLSLSPTLTGTLTGTLTLGALLLSPAVFAQDTVQDTAAEPATATARPLDRQPDVAIPFEKYQLDNGLTVILSEDHSIPFVQVNVWYHVGSKDEVKGRTGFAHLFEHLMFQGSEHMNDDYFVPLQRIGARVNGSTNSDRTNFFEGVPSEQLPLALWLESDRMGWLLPALTQEKLDNQKEVVRNERRQSYENRPYGEVWMWLYENLYPEGHPYHIPTIGLHEDIEAATMDDVSTFFNTWYAPNNATLAIVGDFEPAQARLLVQQNFGDIPRGDPTSPILSVDLPTDWLQTQKVVEKTDDVPQSKVWIAWLSPKLYADGDADLDVLSSLLSDGKDSRLYSDLVNDKQIAKSIEAYQVSSVLSSAYMIEATAAEGHDTQELVDEIDAVLDQLKAQTPTKEELDVAKINWRVRFFGGLQTIARKADMLNSYDTWKGDPGYIASDLQRYLDVTPDSVQAAAQKWLPTDKRVVLHVRPQAAPTDSSPEEGGAQ